MIKQLDPEYVPLTGETTPHPLAPPDGRLAVSLVLAGDSMRRPRFVPATRPDAPSGASNYRF